VKQKEIEQMTSFGNNYKRTNRKQAEQPSPEISRSNSPSHLVYQVSDRDGNKSAIWTRTGAAWPHQDGKGFNLQLSAIPLDGRLTLRVPSEEEG
jgi:hypothetical protein